MEKPKRRNSHTRRSKEKDSPPKKSLGEELSPRAASSEQHNASSSDGESYFLDTIVDEERDVYCGGAGDVRQLITLSTEMLPTYQRDGIGGGAGARSGKKKEKGALTPPLGKADVKRPLRQSSRDDLDILMEAGKRRGRRGLAADGGGGGGGVTRDRRSSSVASWSEVNEQLNVFSPLADELMLRIFGSLPLRDLCAVACVCRRFARLVDDEGFWDQEMERAFGHTIALPFGTPMDERVVLCDNGKVKAATLSKLVDLFTTVHQADLLDQKAFLTTYLNFATPLELLFELAHLYTHAMRGPIREARPLGRHPSWRERERERRERMPEGGGAPEVLSDDEGVSSPASPAAASLSRRYQFVWSPMEVPIVMVRDLPPRRLQDRFIKQVRVSALLKRWIDMSFESFDRETVLHLALFVRARVLRFRNSMLAPVAQSVLLSMIRKVAAARAAALGRQPPKRRERFPQPPAEPQVPRNICSPNFSLFDAPGIEIARQLTLLEFARFIQIQDSELVGGAWRDIARRQDAPNVWRMVESSNALSKWTATVICAEERIRDRVRLVEKFVETCKHLRRLNNFNTLMALLAGLRSHPVWRLRHTFAELSKKAERTYAALSELMEGTTSMRVYRSALTESAPPCIPYVGLHLSDLNMIKDGNPDFIGSLINFQKLRLTYSQVSIFRNMRDHRYNLQYVPQISKLLQQGAIPMKSEDTLLKWSLAREPKDSERHEIQ